MIINISEIKIENRFRKDYGDLQDLANSIKELGLLHEPIVDQDKKLIDGERRIKALKLLGFDEIHVRIINVPSVLKAEHDANAFAKAWTVSEKVAIAKAIEEEIGNRQGSRTDLELVEKFPQVKTRDLVAERSGFGNSRTYQQAKKVIEEGIPDIIEKMDSGDISINAAAIASTFTESEQTEIVEEINAGAKPSEVIKKHVHVNKPVLVLSLEIKTVAASSLHICP